MRKISKCSDSIDSSRVRLPSFARFVLVLRVGRSFFDRLHEVAFALEAILRMAFVAVDRVACVVELCIVELSTRASQALSFILHTFGMRSLTHRVVDRFVIIDPLDAAS